MDIAFTALVASFLRDNLSDRFCEKAIVTIAELGILAACSRGVCAVVKVALYKKLQSVRAQAEADTSA